MCVELVMAYATILRKSLILVIISLILHCSCYGRRCCSLSTRDGNSCCQWSLIFISDDDIDGYVRERLSSWWLAPLHHSPDRGQWSQCLTLYITIRLLEAGAGLLLLISTQEDSSREGQWSRRHAISDDLGVWRGQWQETIDLDDFVGLVIEEQYFTGHKGLGIGNKCIYFPRSQYSKMGDLKI